MVNCHIVVDPNELQFDSEGQAMREENQKLTKSEKIAPIAMLRTISSSRPVIGAVAIEAHSSTLPLSGARTRPSRGMEEKNQNLYFFLSSFFLFSLIN